MNQMTYQPFTFKAALQLTKPPSWTAALSAVAVGGAAAWALHGFVPFIGDNRASACWLLMLLCSLLAQSAVNTLNDYKDFIVGLDTEETITDETDASIIYNAINPRSALYFGLVLCLLAVGVGIVVAVMSVWWLVLLGAGGIIAVLFY
ncbi:MAG: UbiA family prenyltransferase, partial [Coriobacteriales bacterium]|nr:UbiA family prenyltransferase [Coriobacteriales bacterium]